MNGRIYDPLMGRFMSADPFIQAPFELQSHNRYAYVMNNPLGYTDPSGYFSWGGLFRAAAQATVVAVGGYYGGIARAIIGYKAQNNPRAQSLAITVASIGCGGYAPVCAGAGQAALATSYGASESQAWNVGARAGATAWVFQLAGEVTPNDPSSWARYGAHAAAGCVTSAGHCSQGAAAAVLGKWVTNNTRDWGAGIAQGTAAAVAGGVGSVIAGGKFENGAKTAAFGYLFNQMRSKNYKDQRLNMADRAAGIPQSERAEPGSAGLLMQAVMPVTMAPLMVDPIGGSIDAQIEYGLKVDQLNEMAVRRSVYLGGKLVDTVIDWVVVKAAELTVTPKPPLNNTKPLPDYPRCGKGGGC